MPEKVILDPGEQELMRNLANFATRQAIDGVYMGTFYSSSVGAKVLIVVALGDQADALSHVLHSARIPDEAMILDTSGGRAFLGNNGNGH